MSLWESLGLAALRQIDPETAHGLALKALTMGLVPLPGPVTSTRLACNLAGMPLLNPVGLAAGFDKNATAIAPLSRAGFGFIEVGAVIVEAKAVDRGAVLRQAEQARARVSGLRARGGGADLEPALSLIHI